MPGFGIEIHASRVRLVHIFRARLWSANGEPMDPTTLTYDKLIRVAGESKVETEMSYS